MEAGGEGEREVMGEERSNLFCGTRRKSAVISEGSQASPVRPSVKGSLKVNALGWLEAEG
jgi:hypothetical protein